MQREQIVNLLSAFHLLVFGDQLMTAYLVHGRVGILRINTLAVLQGHNDILALPVVENIILGIGDHILEKVGVTHNVKFISLKYMITVEMGLQFPLQGFVSVGGGDLLDQDPLKQVYGSGLQILLVVMLAKLLPDLHILRHLRTATAFGVGEDRRNSDIRRSHGLS